LLENQKVDSEVVDAYQVLLFIPKREGEMPVWMLSKHEKGGRGDLNGARYLEMHAPQNDYLIL
jgi:hypothetical protein